MIKKKSPNSSETISNPVKIQYLFRPLPGVIQQATSLNRPLHQLLPAALHAEQQVLDQDHILFLAEVLQMCSCLVQFNDVVPVGVHLSHKHLHRAERAEGFRSDVVISKGSTGFSIYSVGNVIHVIDVLMSRWSH